MLNSMIINTSFSADLGYENEESRSMSPTPSPVLKNAPATCSTLMLWANHLKETSDKIDAGIMPPPANTLPLNIRRTSLTGLLSCGSNDQTSPPILKSEIIDENSQNSILSTGADNMNHDSMDYINENSMEASNPATMMAPTGLDIMPFPPPPPLMSMTSTSPINVVDLRVKQEEDMAVQIQDLVNPNLGETSKMLANVPTAAQSFIEPFGRSKINDLKVQVNDVPVFSAPTADVLLNTNMNLSSLTSDQHMQQTIGQTAANVFGQSGLMTEAGTANSMNHMLSFPNAAAQSIATNILATSPTNPSPLAAADVMLNSQTIPTMTTSPNALLNVESSVTNPTIESDIIMNTTISPTMMCTNSSTDATNLIANPVAIGDTPMIAAPPQPTSEALLNNLIQPMGRQSDAVVKNMILNAAAEILSSEPNSITAETTSNALMSMEQAPQSTPQHGSPPSITNILTHSDSTSSVVVLAGNNKLIQNGMIVFIFTIFTCTQFTQSFAFRPIFRLLFYIVVAAAAAQNASDIIQNQVVNADMSYSTNPQIVNFQPSTTSASVNLSPAQQNLLNNIQYAHLVRFFPCIK